jgi:cytosine/uracil/thiamine/allantoin permease
LVKKQSIAVEDLYTLSSTGAFNYDGGWNHKALIALAASGAPSIGLSLLGAYGVIFNVGDWGWLIGASAGALVYCGLSWQRGTMAVLNAGG